MPRDNPSAAATQLSSAHGDDHEAAARAVEELDNPSDENKSTGVIAKSSEFLRENSNNTVRGAISSSEDHSHIVAQDTSSRSFPGKLPFTRDGKQIPKPDLSSVLNPTGLAPLPRTGTLAWQQRPDSKTNLPTIPTEISSSNLVRSNPDSASAQEEVSRTQIAQSLGSKDPAWFRQTSDRGLASMAYMKNEDKNLADFLQLRESLRLPGMSRESIVEPNKESSSRTQSVQSNAPSFEGSLRESKVSNQRFSTSAVVSPDRFDPPLPTLDSQRLEPPLSETTSLPETENTSTRGIAMSPSQGRLFQDRGDRPSSPTKGLGGFVQSAMLKRSESQSKRRSAQPGLGLSRGNSMASNRSGYDGSRVTLNTMSSPRERTITTQETSPISFTKSGSGYSTSATPEMKQTDEGQIKSDGASTQGTDSQSNNGFIKPALPNKSRQSPQNIDSSQSMTPRVAEKSSPTTPSKSVDTQKWAPAKASWLQNALNKSDPPKPKAAPPSQPTWMVELTKAKQRRGSVDLQKSAVSKEVETDVLLQSPPIGSSIKSSGLNDRTGTRSPRASNQDRVESINDFPETHSPALATKNEEEFDATADFAGFLPVKSADKETTPTKSDSNFKTTQVLSSNAESIKKSISAKSKPVTPPKKDFRSNLKSRKISEGHAKEEEPEFKNVFGKLKRTQTQNYVAPDQLKGNIMRGKAGLAVTSGPKKTERRDELRDSILKKKEEMKAGVPVNPNRKIGDGGKAKMQEGAVSEAITRKTGLGPPENSIDSKPSPTTTDLEVLEAVSLKNVRTEKSIHTSENQPSVPGRMQREPAGSSDIYNPNLAGILSRSLSPMTGATKSYNVKDSTSSYISRPIVTGEKANGGDATSAQLTHATKGRARGPKRRLPTIAIQDSTPLENVTEKSERRLNTSTPKKQSLDDKPIVELSDSTDNSENTLFTPPSKSFTLIKKPVLYEVKSSSPRSRSLLDDSSTPTNSTPIALKLQPRISPASPQIRKPSTKVVNSPPTPMTPKPQIQAKSEPRLTEADLTLTATSNQPQPRKESSLNPISGPLTPQHFQRHQPEEAADTVMIGAGHIGTTYNYSSTLRPQKPKPPAKLPTRNGGEAAVEVTSLSERKQFFGLGIHSPAGDSNTQNIQHSGLPSPPLQSPPRASKPLPLPPTKPESIATRVVSNGRSSLVQSSSKGIPDPGTLRAHRLITEILGGAPVSKTIVDIDTHKVLSSRASAVDSDKIKTLRKQIWQISGDGKKTSIAPHQEHILCEENMYLCTHVFGSLAFGTRTTEVYFWHGEAVPSSAVDDAQIFARKAAKENNGKLIILRQGKETSNFFQALGGIVVTRHGYNSTYMLCGRKHVGQIAFDEVPFTAGSLCSGFPYIISAPFGKLYLWKGKGSGHDELGCARLIGMDLGLTGEIEEVEEGNESEDFWNAFPNRKKLLAPFGDSYWHLKPSCENINTRLFVIDVETPPPKSSSGLTFGWGRRGSTPVGNDKDVAKITEIYPFAQFDLQNPGVFVLDTFFEIFVYVAPVSSHMPC